MFAEKRSPALLGDRIDADFYAPLYVTIEQKLRGCGVSVGRLGDRLERVFKGAFYLLASEYQETGIPFVRVTQITSGFVDLGEAVYLAPATHQREIKTAVRPGYLLFAKGGAYRHCAVIPSSLSEANISQDLIGAVPGNGLDPHYAHSFLSCQFGRPQLIRWQQGDAQPHLSNDSVKHIMLPLPHDDAQAVIGNKVRQAERLRERATALSSSINRLVAVDAVEQAMQSTDSRTNRLPAADLDSRLDAKFYGPRAMRVLYACQTAGGVPLRELEPDVSNGFELRDFVPEGTPYLTVGDVVTGRLDLMSCPRIPIWSQVPDKAKIDVRCVLVVRSGSIGAAAKVHEEDTAACISSHLIRLRFSTEAVAAAVAAFLNSRAGVLLQDKIIYGGVQPQISQDELLDIPIPRCVLDNGEAILGLLNSREEAIRNAQRLTTAAKLLVETLIEGDVTEAELLAAHGDVSEDRRLLQRLTRNGIDLQGEPPLFPDLDALQQVIADASGA